MIPHCRQNGVFLGILIPQKLQKIGFSLGFFVSTATTGGIEVKFSVVITAGISLFVSETGDINRGPGGDEILVSSILISGTGGICCDSGGGIVLRSSFLISETEDIGCDSEPEVISGSSFIISDTKDFGSNSSTFIPQVKQNLAPLSLSLIHI